MEGKDKGLYGGFPSFRIRNGPPLGTGVIDCNKSPAPQASWRHLNTRRVWLKPYGIKYSCCQSTGRRQEEVLEAVSISRKKKLHSQKVGSVMHGGAREK